MKQRLWRASSRRIYLMFRRRDWSGLQRNKHTQKDHVQEFMQENVLVAVFFILSQIVEIFSTWEATHEIPMSIITCRGPRLDCVYVCVCMCVCAQEKEKKRLAPPPSPSMSWRPFWTRPGNSIWRWLTPVCRRSPPAWLTGRKKPLQIFQVRLRPSSCSTLIPLNLLNCSDWV